MKFKNILRSLLLDSTVSGAATAGTKTPSHDLPKSLASFFSTETDRSDNRNRMYLLSDLDAAHLG